MTFKQAHYCHL